MDPEYQKEIDSLWAAIKALQNPALIDHFHNGFDSSPIVWSDIKTRKTWVRHTIIGTAAATAANYATFYIARFPATITGFWEVHEVLGTDAGAVTLTLEKLTGTQAPDAGTLVLASTLSLKSTINTVQAGTITSTIANRNLAIGDRLCLKDAGTLTAVSNVSVIVELTMI